MSEDDEPAEIGVPARTGEAPQECADFSTPSARRSTEVWVMLAVIAVARSGFDHTQVY